MGYFYDIDFPTDPQAPTESDIQAVIDWLVPRCAPSSEARFIIHCDAGLGRSTAVAYIAWSIFLGAGLEQEAFQAMKDSCLNLHLVPNAVIIAHADKILRRNGALKKPLSQWNKTVRWRRTFR